jgi:hypothetical protein
MSIRLDPRRATALKHLAGEAGVRPGDLVRQWVEERIDARHTGAEATASPGSGVMARLDELSARIAELEARATETPVAAATPSAAFEPATAEEAAPVEEAGPIEEAAPIAGTRLAKPRGRPRKSASAAPAGPRVSLHDEMIAVIGERGPMSAGELAQVIAERGRYVPPRSGKPLDAAMVSQRVSNPTYRSRFTRSEGRIGLAEDS